MFTIQFKITNLTCEACVKLSQSALRKIPGVQDANVDLPTGLGALSASRAVTQDEVVSALENVSKQVMFPNT